MENQPSRQRVLSSATNGEDGSTSLLIFDPSANGTKLKENLENHNTGAWKRQIKRNIFTLHREAYQIVHIPPGETLMSPEEREVSKVMNCVQIDCTTSSSSSSSRNSSKYK